MALISGAASRRQLDLIGEIAALARTDGAELWLRGGWAMDFFLGKVTRPHEDIDLFTLETHIIALDGKLRSQGYTPTGTAPPEQQRDYLKDGFDVSIGPVRIGDDGAPLVAGGRFVGEPWPADMLSDAGWGDIGGLRMRYIAPTAQIECKQMTPVWMPWLSRREKDAHDIEAIRQAMNS